MNKSRPHVGIVGCSAEGAALCYRTFCVEGAAIFGRHAHPDVSMHTHCLADYMNLVEMGNWRGVAELMLSSARRLHEIGAELLICPDNTIHQAYEYVRPESPVPWLHIADVAVSEAKKNKTTCLGVLGTRFLMEGPVYRNACEKVGLGFIIPEENTRSRINRIIFDELVNGIISQDSQKFFHDTIDALREQGCDGVVLGCTEIPLIVDPKLSSIPTFDSTRLLARAALRWAETPQDSRQEG